MHRRIDVAEVELVGRKLPVGMHVPFAEHAAELLAGEGRVEPRQGNVWKARSQAANQGYSHLSGMESTSRQKRCGQSALRPDLRSAGGGGISGSPSSQSSTT